MTRKTRKNEVNTAVAAIVTLMVAALTLLACINAADPGAEPAEGASRESSKVETTQDTPKTEAEPKTETETPAPEIDPYEVELIGRTIWGEAMGVKSKAERAAVAWCILNRVDAWGQSIEYVVTKPRQFQGYRPNGVCPQEHLDLAADVLTRWKAEKEGAPDVGRVLPADYLYFIGDGERNHFSTEYLSTNYWGWSLADPYK